tara:strand:+ start:1175 stop:1468 length:294 start_codon:yes stop_codon:yes gene_type:complete
MLLGFIMLRFPPKEINSIYGYRTKASMRNQKSWNFAQKQSSKLMIDISCYQIIFGLASMVLNLSIENSILFGLIITILNPLIVIIKIEKLLSDKKYM